MADFRQSNLLFYFSANNRPDRRKARAAWSVRPSACVSNLCYPRVEMKTESIYQLIDYRTIALVESLSNDTP
jgi:hypothetical protein